VVVLSGITIRTGYPIRAPIMARLIPVLPLDGSRMVCPGRSAPDATASASIERAIRSFTEPVGFAPSIFANSRTPGRGASRRSSTIGVWPMAATMSPRIIGLVGPSSHGGQQNHLVIREDRRSEAGRVPNVATVDVQVDERRQLPIRGHSLAEGRMPREQVVQDLVHGPSGGLQLPGSAHSFAENRRDANSAQEAAGEAAAMAAG
jgi:hypothetical protein